MFMFNLIKTKLQGTDKEYFYYHSLLKRLIKERQEKEIEIDNTIHILECEFNEYVNQIKKLENEILKIRQEKNINVPHNNDENENEDIDIILEKTESENINNKNIKKLFRIISKQCHPDKTDDTSLNDLFVLANDAYSKNNYNILLEIYNKLKYNKDSNFNISLEDKINLLKQQFSKEKEYFENFTKTNTYVINSLYKSDNYIDNFRAKQLFSEILFQRMVELENIITSIK